MMTFLSFVAQLQLEAQWASRVRTVTEPEAEAITLEEAQAHLRVDLFGTPPESDDDFWLENIGIPAACRYAEYYMEASYSPRTLELSSNTFPSSFMILPYGPVQEVESIKYDDQAAYDAAYEAAYDTAYQIAYDAEFLLSGDELLADAAGIAAGVAAGVPAGMAALEQTVPTTVYTLDQWSSPSRVILLPDQVWPTARDSANSVRVRYVTGYSTADETPQVFMLPKTVKMAMLLMLGHLYENREAVNVGSVVTSFPLSVHALLDITTGGMRTDFA